MVRDINPSGSSFPYHLTEVNGTLFFIADDGTNGYELWKYNPCTDTDDDGICDEDDNCPEDPDNDEDGDDWCGNEDNCPLVSYPGQEDIDSDGIGNACDEYTDPENALAITSAYIATLDVSGGLKNALNKKLEKAILKHYCDEKYDEAIEKLNAFKDQLYDLWQDEKITEVEYNDLTAMADVLLNAVENRAITCPETSNMVVSPQATLYPNPASHELTIYLENEERTPTTLTIYDQLGRPVWTEQIETGQVATRISLHDSRFGNGLYFVKMISGGESVTLRFMVHK